MKYLLDTNIIIRWLIDEALVGESLRKIIRNTNNIIFISSASIWEISIKTSKKKLHVPNNYVEILFHESFTPLSITIDHVQSLSLLPVYEDHVDPFDRIVIAQAMVERATMLTTDPLFDRYDIPVIHP